MARRRQGETKRDEARRLVAAQDARRRAEQHEMCDTSWKLRRIVEWASTVTLRTARILLGGRNAEIEANSEWETVVGEVEEADMLYPGLVLSALSLSGAPLSFPARLLLAELACIYAFPEPIVLAGEIHACPQTVANDDVLRRATRTGRRPA
jgi:hypothetical protein